jgi:hypothetical protein
MVIPWLGEMNWQEAKQIDGLTAFDTIGVALKYQFPGRLFKAPGAGPKTASHDH